MTTEDKIKLVQQCIDTAKEIHSMEQKWKDFTGSFPSCVPIYELLWSIHLKLSINVANFIGDSEGWMDWHIWENECGKRAFEASVAGRKPKKIKTARDLVRLIESE